MGVTEGFAEVYLLRHGESTANARGLFTGVLDPELTELGREEARRAAILLLEAGVHPARVFCSALQRTTQTAQEMSAVIDLPPHLEIEWRLDERNYGALTGLSKADVARRAGQARYREWRRSYDAAPPPMSEADMARLRGRPPFNRLPAEAVTATESLADVVRRITPFLGDVLLPALSVDRPILLIAHGNSLRALLFVVQQLTREQVEQLNIPTGHPLRCRFEQTNGRFRLQSATYLDPEAAAVAADVLRSQGGT